MTHQVPGGLKVHRKNTKPEWQKGQNVFFLLLLLISSSDGLAQYCLNVGWSHKQLCMQPPLHTHYTHIMEKDLSGGVYAIIPTLFCFPTFWHYIFKAFSYLLEILLECLGLMNQSNSDAYLRLDIDKNLESTLVASIHQLNGSFVLLAYGPSLRTRYSS